VFRHPEGENSIPNTDRPAGTRPSIPQFTPGRLRATDRATAEPHLVRETMAAMEARLDPARFARIHRSTIVNLARIRELQPTFNGEYAVLLHSGAKLTLSRGYRDALRSRLGTDW
jgi:DNA-binding LytR/AlgR family response regulator